MADGARNSADAASKAASKGAIATAAELITTVGLLPNSRASVVGEASESKAATAIGLATKAAVWVIRPALVLSSSPISASVDEGGVMTLAKAWGIAPRVAFNGLLGTPDAFFARSALTVHTTMTHAKATRACRRRDGLGRARVARAHATIYY